MTYTKYLARICWNDKDWIGPAGCADQAESNSWAAEHGWGHEEWLFNTSKCIDGWHYSFLQPIDKSRPAKLKRGEKHISVYLWTKDPDRARLYVGELPKCELLDHTQAARAVSEYKRRGWLKEMSEQLESMGLSPHGFSAANAPAWIFNIRFRPESAILYESAIRVPGTHAAARLGRYNLPRMTDRYEREWPSRSRQDTLKRTKPSLRKAVKATIVAHEHDILQNHIIRMLRKKHGNNAVAIEESWIDIQCDDGRHLHFIEIKSDPRAKLAIRQAIGQLLEYAYFRPRRGRRAPWLHVVAPGPMDDETLEYIARLKDKFGLIIRYHRVTRETKTLDLSRDP